MVCDVIWENLADGEANSVFLDQPFLFISIHKYLNYAESEKSDFDPEMQ